MKYVCENTDCKNYGIEEFFSKENYKYKNGKLIGEHAICPVCGNIRKEINSGEEIPLSQKNISANLFNSMSTDEKREVLRKRTHEHFNKFIKDKKDTLIHSAAKEFADLHRD